MRKLTRISVSVLLIAIVLVFTAAPWLAGIYCQHQYPTLMSAYALPGVQVKIIQYKRNWFTSDATVSLDIRSSPIDSFFETLGMTISKQYIVNQSIQHGPFIYHPVQGLSSIWGWIVIQNTWHSSNLDSKIMPSVDNDLILLSGEHLKHIKIGPVKAINLKNNTHIKLSSIDAQFRIGHSHDMRGDLMVKGLYITDEENSISIPALRFQFDDKNHLWIGSNSINIPKIIWKDVSGKTVFISGVQFNGLLEEKSGILNGSRQFDISQIDIENHPVGPIHFEMSVNKLNAKGVVDLVRACQAIMERGELYQSQLQQKIRMLLPNVINPGANVKLEKLHIMTPNGMFQMNGEMDWSLDAASKPDDLVDLIQAANAKMNLRISKPLANQWIKLASSFSFLNQIDPSALQDAYEIAQKETRFAMYQNASFIIEMMQNKQLSDNDATNLLNLQKKNVSEEEYGKEIAQLLLNKNISRELSYYLLLQYINVKRPLGELTYQIKKNQEKTEQGLNDQLTAWINSGFIKQEQNDYVFSILQQKGSLKINQNK